MVDAEQYRHLKENILKYVRERGIDSVGMFAASTMVPLIPIYTFIAEDMEEYREVALERINGLKQFYGIKE